MAGLLLLLLLLASPFLLVAAFSLSADDNFLLYPDSFEDSREEEDETCTCRKDLSQWDKTFVMLEDSQMRQSMLLHAVEETLAGQVEALRSELGRALAHRGLACPADPAAARLAKLWELRHEGTAKRLQEVFLLVLGLHNRLGALEERPDRPVPGSRGERDQCLGLAEELRQARAQLSDLRPREPTQPSEVPPAGCQRTLTLAAHPEGIPASVLPAVNRDLLAFTACVWAKPSGAMERGVLFSYCTQRAGAEFRLELSRGAARFSVGRAGVDSRAGPTGKWTLYCGVWDGKAGKATLVVDGRAVASGGPRAGPRSIPGRGAVQLGRETADCRTGGSDEESAAFAGSLTGFNLWDAAATEAEVGLLLRGNGCDVNGNVVGWGVSPVTVGRGDSLH
uniref:pentraxin-related protein PTX3-like n=1 Tax=Pristiophorus japonicus TaxID=55135 RepID=UPI00398E8985